MADSRAAQLGKKQASEEEEEQRATLYSDRAPPKRDESLAGKDEERELGSRSPASTLAMHPGRKARPGNGGWGAGKKTTASFEGRGGKSAGRS